MKTLKLKCTLLSDIVLNTTAGTEGKQSSLDFIPGSNFLGIAALCYNDMTAPEQMEIFHSGKVRFGDAHPAKDGDVIRSLHVPATWFYPKGHDASEGCYASQGYHRSKDTSNNGKPMQLKQCRSGYYAFKSGEGKPVAVEKSFALKSAYDREARRAKDNQMYGYESLNGGQAFLFEVEIDNDGLAETLHKALLGTHRIGRSRTAQYGLVSIEDATFEDVPSRSNPINTVNGRRVAVYADSRLIFLDKSGRPTLQPEASDLGLEGTIDWELSQVRTFQYAPWNGKRQTRDCDRCGIEKGSVFFVDCDAAPSASRYVGSYRNEGFGRVIYNPDFLEYSGDNGQTRYQLHEAGETVKHESDAKLKGTPLLDFLSAKQSDYRKEGDVAEKVNDFVAKYGELFRGVSFASQWGHIRKIAMTHPTKDGIIRELYDKTEIRHHYPSPNDSKEEDREVNVGYLAHGIAQKKWKQKERAKRLRDFIDSIADKNDVQQAVVNLSSEMAKICTRNGKN